MSNNALLPLISCAMVLTAVGADYGLGQMDVPKPRRLPVETFPTTIGVWKGGPVLQVDPEVQKKLLTAKIVERAYTNPSGLSVDLLLLTATEDEDMHSPKACLPAQGWALSNIQSTEVDGQPATQMTAKMDDGDSQKVLYWLTGYYPPKPPTNAFLQRASDLRTHIMGGHNNMSLFVRIIAADTPLGRRALTDFTASLHAPIQALVGTGAVAARAAVRPHKF